MRIVLAALCALLAFSCATIPVEFTKYQNPDTRVAPAPIVLNGRTEFFSLRVDIDRNYSVTGNGRNYFRDSPIAVDFGNGIIIDGNWNLCIDLASLYGFDTSKDFDITATWPTVFGPFSKLFKKIGQDYQIVRIPPTGITANENISRLDSENVSIIAPLFDNQKVIIAPTALEYTDGAIFNPTATKLSSSPQGITVATTGPFSRTEEFSIDPLTNAVVSKSGKFKLIRNSDLSISIIDTDRHFRWNFVFIKTDTGCYFYDKDTFQGFEISRQGNVISIISNAKVTNTFTIR